MHHTVLNFNTKLTFIAFLLKEGNGIKFNRSIIQEHLYKSDNQ